MASDGPPQGDQDDKVGDTPTERTRSGSQSGDDKLTETIRARLEHLVPELVRKTFAAGLGAVSSTEEGIRKMARDVSLPDVAAYIASSADGARGKVWEVVARETREFLSNLNLTEELAKVLTTLSFEIKTEVRFIPNSERLTGSEPDVRTAVRVKRSKPDDPAKSQSRDKQDDAAMRDDLGDPWKSLSRGKSLARDNKSRLRFWRRDDGGGSDEDVEPSLEDKPGSKSV